MTNDLTLDQQTTWAKSWSDYFKAFFADSNPTENNPQYPQRPYRYYRFGWNHNHQYCYTDEDVRLAQRLQEKFNNLGEPDKQSMPFTLRIEKKWYDWWECQQPISDNLRQVSNTFTLPNREAKDTSLYPLWNYADNMARQIANWQGERIKNQNVNLMNDPVMLVFEELKYWFFHDLAEKSCKKDDLEYIAKRQSYIRNIIHSIPNFGPDRLYLHEIQNRLQQAAQIIVNCVANKQLPDLLSDIIIKTKSLETTIGTYLHFLLVNEDVADNFSSEFTESTQLNCHLSPVCKIYQNAKVTSSENSIIDNTLLAYLDFNKFFKIDDFFENDKQIQFKIGLKNNLLKNINFAKFVTDKDKTTYLESIAALESLISVRKTLEHFKNIQSSIGTYIFAVNYLQKTNLLSENYINLIGKSQSLIEDLLRSANNGLKLILKNPQESPHGLQYFEKNIRALDTMFAKDTTASNQLHTYCSKAITSMHAYQDEMKKLVAHLNSGEAAQEIGNAMQNLVFKINYINSFLPAQLGEKQFTLDKDRINTVIGENTLPQLPETTEAMNSVNGMKITNSEKDVCFAMEKPNNDKNKENIFTFFADNPTQALLTDEVSKVTNLPYNMHGKWDHHIKHDPVSGQPIYTLRVFSDSKEIGSAEFFNEPILCVSEDGTQHNIIKLTGILNAVDITEQTSITQICKILPPSLFDKVVFSVKHGAANGFLRGGTNIIGATLRAGGMAPQIANFMSQCIYYSSIFTMNFHTYIQQFEDEELAPRYISALYQAAMDTGTVAIFSFILDQMSVLLDKASHSLESQWSLVGKGVKKLGSLLRFGIFAYSAADKSLVETSAAVISGTLAQSTVEYVGNKLL